MSKNYPSIGEFKRQPDKRDGFNNIGSPCVVCGINTMGQLFIEVNYMRGDDDLVRVCSTCKKDRKGIMESYRAKIKALNTGEE